MKSHCPASREAVRKAGGRMIVWSAVAIICVGVSGAAASGAYPGGTTGFDISFPQCGGAYPASGFYFGIVGVTGGRAFSENPCLASEFQWAEAGTMEPSLYMNLQYPRGTTSDKGLTGPAGDCARKDKACIAYNYGWNAAQEAVAYADSQGAPSTNWWLDIETGNSWSTATELNAAVIGAAIDSLQSMGIWVGIYSTKNAWSRIAGSYAPGLDNWTPGAADLASAPGYCSSSYAFGGGAISLVQYPSGDYDGIYACP